MEVTTVSGICMVAPSVGVGCSSKTVEGPQPATVKNLKEHVLCFCIGLQTSMCRTAFFGLDVFTVVLSEHLATMWIMREVSTLLAGTEKCP